MLSYEIKIKGYKINMSNELEKYYNKFCEEKRLTRRHGNVEYITSMKYIHKYLKDKNAKILDTGYQVSKEIAFAKVKKRKLFFIRRIKKINFPFLPEIVVIYIRHI